MPNGEKVLVAVPGDYSLTCPFTAEHVLSAVGAVSGLGEYKLTLGTMEFFLLRS